MAKKKPIKPAKEIDYGEVYQPEDIDDPVPDNATGYCSICCKRVTAYWIDTSYSTEFGLKKEGHWECAECESDVIDTEF